MNLAFIFCFYACYNFLILCFFECFVLSSRLPIVLILFPFSQLAAIHLFISFYNNYKT